MAEKTQEPVDGITAISKGIENTNTLLLEYKDTFIGKTLDDLYSALGILHDDNVGFEKTLDNISGSEDVKKLMDKNKMVASQLNTGAKNVSEIKSSSSDRIGFVVLANMLSEFFDSVLGDLDIQTQSLSLKNKDAKKEKTKSVKKQDSGMMSKTFANAVNSFKSIPNKIVAPFKGIAGKISGVFKGVSRMITAPFNKIKDGISGIFTKAKGFFTGIPKLLGGFFGKLNPFKKKDNKGGDAGSVAIIAGDATGASQYMTTFKKITKQLKRIKPIDTKQLQEISKSITSWAKSFNKDILSLKINNADIENFAISVEKSSEAIKKASKHIIKSIKLNDKITKMVGRKTTGIFSGIKNFIIGLNKSLGEIENMDDVAQNVKNVKTISLYLVDTSHYIIDSIPSLLLVRGLMVVKPFTGIEKWVKGIKSTFGKKNTQDAVKKSEKSVEAIKNISVNLLTISKSIIKSFVPMMIVTAMFKSEKLSDLYFSGIVNYSKALDKSLVNNKEMPDEKKLKKTSKVTSSILRITETIQKLVGKIIIFGFTLLLLLPVLFITKLAVVKGMKMVGSQMEAIGEATTKMKKSLKLGNILLATLSLIMMIPMFTVMLALLPIILVATGLTMLLNLLKFDKVFDTFSNSMNKTLEAIKKIKLKDILIATLTCVLLVVFAVVLILATVLLTISLPFVLLSSLTMIFTIALFTLLKVVGNIAQECLQGILATILASITLVILGVCLLAATIALALVATIIIASGPKILLSLAALIVMFGLIIGIGFIAPTVIVGALAACLASIAIAVMAVMTLIAVTAMVKIADIIINNPTVLKGLLGIVALFGIVCLFASVAPLALVGAVALLLASTALVPAFTMTFVAFSIISKMPPIAPILDNLTAMIGVFSMVALLGPLGLVAMAAGLILTISVGIVGSAIKKAFKEFIAASILASMFKADKLLEGIMAIEAVNRVVSSLNFSNMGKKFKEMAKGIKEVPKPKDAANLVKSMTVLSLIRANKIMPFLKLTQIMSALDFESFGANMKLLKQGLKETPNEKDTIRFVDAMIVMEALSPDCAEPLVKVMNTLERLDCANVAKNLLGLNIALRLAPSASVVGKFAKAINAFNSIDTNGLETVTSSLTASFQGLSNTGSIVNNLSSAIHSLNTELKDLSSKSNAVKILRDLQGGGGGSNNVTDAKSASSSEGTGTNEISEEKTFRRNIEKAVNDLNTKLDAIKNAIANIKPSNSWMH